MIATAKCLEQAELGLRRVICDLVAVAPSSPAIYATILELAAVGQAIQERIRRGAFRCRGRGGSLYWGKYLT